MSMRIDRERIALAVQQPWAELIVCGIKSIEIRATSVRVPASIYVYASRKPSSLPDAAIAASRYGFEVAALPRGVVVGTANLVECRLAVAEDAEAACVGPEILDGQTAWRFTDPVKFNEPIAVRFQPYGIWFYPFRRRNVGQQ